MKRIFHRYEKWEDFKNGMYQERKDNQKSERIEQSIALLKTDKELYQAMRHVAFMWIASSEVNMSNRGCNRQAWLGQAACNYMINSTESEVRQAWNLLEDDDRIKANGVADRVIELWEKYYPMEVPYEAGVGYKCARSS